MACIFRCCDTSNWRRLWRSLPERSSRSCTNPASFSRIAVSSRTMKSLNRSSLTSLCLSFSAPLNLSRILQKKSLNVNRKMSATIEAMTSWKGRWAHLLFLVVFLGSGQNAASRPRPGLGSGSGPGTESECLYFPNFFFVPCFFVILLYRYFRMTGISPSFMVEISQKKEPTKGMRTGLRNILVFFLNRTLCFCVLKSKLVLASIWLCLSENRSLCWNWRLLNLLNC